MKKIINLLLLISLLFVSSITLAFTDTNGNGIDDASEGGGGSGILDLGDQTNIAQGLDQYKLIKNKPLTDILDTVANYMVGILVIMAIFYILWAAYTFITSAGSEEKVSEARKRIMFAAIGIIVALITKGIVALVLSLTTAVSSAT